MQGICIRFVVREGPRKKRRQGSTQGRKGTNRPRSESLRILRGSGPLSRGVIGPGEGPDLLPGEGRSLVDEEMKTQVLGTKKKAGKAKENFIRREVPCGFCQETGRDPFLSSWPNSLCQICRGRKRNLILLSPREEKLKSCPFCKGRGIHPFSRMSCTSCKGKGWVVVCKDWGTCPLCQGEGREQEKAFECTKCAGKGEIRTLS